MILLSITCNSIIGTAGNIFLVVSLFTGKNKKFIMDLLHASGHIGSKLTEKNNEIKKVGSKGKYQNMLAKLCTCKWSCMQTSYPGAETS